MAEKDESPTDEYYRHKNAAREKSEGGPSSGSGGPRE